MDTTKETVATVTPEDKFTWDEKQVIVFKSEEEMREYDKEHGITFIEYGK